MIGAWYKAKRAELREREARASCAARLLESASDPWGEPEPDEPDWVAITGSETKVGLPEDTAAIRSKCQQLYYQNPTARGIIESYVAFIVGSGFGIRGEDEAATKRVEDLADTIGFPGLSSEAVRRFFRDGEVFMRLFPASEAVRFIDPVDVVDENGNEAAAIVTKDDDVETVTGYLVKMGDDDYQVIPADEVLHLKHGVDANVKRGLPLLYSVIYRLRRYDTWLDDLGTLIKLRTAIALIRKHEGSTPSIVKTFADNKATETKADGTRLKKFKPGTIIDAHGIDYEFKSPNVDAADLGEYGRFCLLSVASGVNLAEYMVSADASNSNYASIEVAETHPFTVFNWHQKNTFAPAFAEMFERLLGGSEEGMVAEGAPRVIIIPAAMPVRDLKNTVDANDTMQMDGILSRETFAARMGLDYQQEQEQMETEAETATKAGKVPAPKVPAEKPPEGEPEPETPEAGETE